MSPIWGKFPQNPLLLLWWCDDDDAEHVTFANAAMLAAPFESNGLTGIVIRSGTKSNWHFCPILQHDDDDEKRDD